MGRNTTITSVLLPLLLLLGTSVSIRAEVSCDPPGNSPDNLFLGIIVDDPDPVGLWKQYRYNIPPEYILNPGGDDREDGVPHVVYTASAWPVAAWSWETGSDGDIAYAEWNGSAWSPTEFLTEGFEDELDPHVTLEPDGTVHVVWWVDGPTEEVWMRTRPAGGSVWNPPIHVTDGPETGPIGAGGNREEMENHGTDWHRRFKLMRERIEAMQAIWTQDEASYAGEFTNFEAIWSWPKPVQKPHPPIFVGGDGAGTLARVLRYGDGWIPMLAERGEIELEPKLARMRELAAMAAEAGRPPPPITTFGTPRDPATIERLRDAGVTCCIFGLKAAPEAEILPRLDKLTAMLAGLDAA